MSPSPARSRKRSKLRNETRLLRALVVSAVILAVVLGLALRSLAARTGGTEVGLDEALRRAAAAEVETAVFHDHDARVVLRLRDGGETLWAAYPSSGAEASSLIATMVEHGARVEVDQQWGKRLTTMLAQFVLPLLVLANLFGIFILLARGGTSQVRELFAFGRIRARRSSPTHSEVTFADVAAADDSIAELAEVRDYLEDPSRFAALGALPPKGVLLSGPPGCGKTLLARALAGEAKVPFFYLSGSEFVESLVGVGAARVRDLFRQVRVSAPAIVFVDELDAAGRRRGAGIGGGHDEREQTLNELLVQMDGFSPTSGIVVLGATNRPDILDPALLRPGRFDRHVAVDAPDRAGRLDILELHAQDRPLADDVDLDAVARVTPGFTGADLANVVNEAALLTVRRHGRRIGGSELAEAVERVLGGTQRRGRPLTEDELRRLAYHEAGHVVVASATDLALALRRVSVVSRGANAAHSAFARQERTVLGRGELMDELTVLVAGLVAEELAVGEASTAFESDIGRATELARRMVGAYGMSEEIGRVRLLRVEGEVFLGRDYLTAQAVGADTLSRADDAIRLLVADAEERARALLTRRRAVLDRLAAALVEHETLGEAEVGEILAARVGVETPAKRRPASKRPAGG